MPKCEELRKLLCLCALPCSRCPNQENIHVFPPIQFRRDAAFSHLKYTTGDTICHHSAITNTREKTQKKYEIYAASASSVFCKRGSINQISAKPKSAPVMRRSSHVLSRRPNIWVKPSQAIGTLKRIKPHQGMPRSRFLVSTKASPLRNIEP